MPTAGSMPSAGTRVACIPVHRLCKDARMSSPKKTIVVAECSPRMKHATRSCQLTKSPQTSACQSDASSNCRLSVNALYELQQAQAEEQMPRKVEESKGACVKEKCCRSVKMQKSSSPIATHLCTVSLSRLVIPEKSDISEAIKRESEVKDCAVVCDDVLSTATKSLFVPNNDTAFNAENEVGSSSLPVSIVYPSCEQNAFLGNFGLANKAELPQLRNAAGSRLHREIGGTLRRSVRPNLAVQMKYRRTNSMRCVSFEDGTDASNVELSARSLHASRESSPWSLHTHDFASVAMKKLSSAVSKQQKSSVIDKPVDSHISAVKCKIETSANTADYIQDQPHSSLSILADMALAHLKASDTQDAADVLKQSPAKSKVRFDV